MSNDNYGWPTSRCFPRTLKDAFRDDPENARWWYPPKRSTMDKILITLGVFMWVGIGMTCALLLGFIYYLEACND
jgi:hypothetical protein